MSRAARAVGALALVGAVLTGCTQGPSVGGRAAPEPTSTTPPAAAPSSAAQARELAAQKKRAGIADCPVSDPTVSPISGGLPDVVLGCLGGGREVRLAGLRGRPMMINVWAQWCGPCRAEAPYLTELAQGNTSDLLILGVDYVDGVQPDKAIEFAQTAGWTYPQLADTDKVLAGPLQILGPPYTFFVRADGTIAGRHSGAFRSTEQIRALVRQHLGVRS